MNEQLVTIVPFSQQHRDALLSLSLRAWEPVFSLLEREALPFVYQAFYPNGWRERQRSDLAQVLEEESGNIDVALDGDRPIGWVCTRLHPEDNRGEIYIIAVEPDHQQRGVGRALMARSFARCREAGMTMVMVETGGDSGHAPARAAYESVGFERWPVARYFKDISN